MPIQREDGFFQTHDLAHVSCLGIETRRLAACVKRIQLKRIKGVFGSPSFGFTGTHLDFLAELPKVEVVWFWDVNLTSIDGLYALRRLRHFGVHPKRPPIDFSRFPELRKVVLLHPKPQDRGLGGLKKVELLHVWHYHPKDKTFASLELPSSLTELQILWATPASLESLPAVKGLRRLEIHRCRNLAHLGGLAKKYPNLEYLVVDNCGRVSRREGNRVVRDLPKLTHAYFQGDEIV